MTRCLCYRGEFSPIGFRSLFIVLLWLEYHHLKPTGPSFFKRCITSRCRLTQTTNSVDMMRTGHRDSISQDRTAYPCSLPPNPTSPTINLVEITSCIHRLTHITPHSPSQEPPRLHPPEKGSAAASTRIDPLAIATGQSAQRLYVLALFCSFNRMSILG